MTAFEELLGIGDDALVTAQRLSGWCTRAPRGAVKGLPGPREGVGRDTLARAPGRLGVAVPRLRLSIDGASQETYARYRRGGDFRRVMANLLKRAANIAKGSAEPNKTKVGTVTAKQVEEIAKIKLPDLNCDSLESAIKTVAGTARSMGLDVVG